MNHYKTIISPLGEMTLSAANGKLVGLFFGTQRFAPSPNDAESSLNELRANDDVLKLTERWLTPEFELIGSDFQVDVWNAILQIPYGQTCAYRDIERYLERKNKKEAHALAVGSAAAKNNLAIIVPCHRVIPADGSVGEYNAGVFRKQWLLACEGVRL